MSQQLVAATTKTPLGGTTNWALAFGGAPPSSLDVRNEQAELNTPSNGSASVPFPVAIPSRSICSVVLGAAVNWKKSMSGVLGGVSRLPFNRNGRVAAPMFWAAPQVLLGSTSDTWLDTGAAVVRVAATTSSAG